MYYTTQWNFMILSKLSHMTVTSPNETWIRVVDTVRRFCHFLLWRGEVYVDLMGNFDPKKMTPNFNALTKIDYFLPMILLLSICFFSTMYNYVIYKQNCMD